jgi:spermidine dehydrogenase
VTLSHQEASGSGETDYPPKLTGMRGSHDGSFEIAHGMRYGATWEEAAATGEY